MFNFKTIVAASVVVGAATGASAAVVTIDDFASNPFQSELLVENTSASDMQVLSTDPSIERTVTFERLANVGGGTPATATLEIGGGFLSLENGARVDSQLTLSYDVESLFDAGGVTGFDLLFNNFGTGGDTTIEAVLNGNSLGMAMLNNGEEGTLSFSFSQMQAMGDPDTLTFIINGSAGYDLLLGPITANVPEPGALGLLGLGLLGIAAAKRRRAAA